MYEDDNENDSIQYGIMSSNEWLYNSSMSNLYFHLGSPTNLHYDDTSTIPISGLDLVATISSGPYSLLNNQSLVFYTTVLAGDDYQDINNNLSVAKNVFNSLITNNSDFENEKTYFDFFLSQNYPNPFNPSSTIFSIKYPATRQCCTLQVYDVLGREIATLVNEEKEPGIYRTEFNTRDYQLASGIYLYRLQAGSYVETKKMVLMK